MNLYCAVKTNTKIGRKTDGINQWNCCVEHIALFVVLAVLKNKLAVHYDETILH